MTNSDKSNAIFFEVHPFLVKKKKLMTLKSTAPMILAVGSLFNQPKIKK